MKLLKIYFFGKKNELLAWEKEYLKRINFRCKCELIPLNQAGIADIDKVKEVEAKNFLSKIDDKSFLIAFDENGIEKNSVDFAQWFERKREVFDEIIFVIGGAYGLDQSVLDRANVRLRFGRMVWSRNLFRLMALEQIYRALDIVNGGNFHKS